LVVFSDKDPLLVHTICFQKREQTVYGAPPELPLCP
jgi:hypothetical protein